MLCGPDHRAHPESRLGGSLQLSGDVEPGAGAADRDNLAELRSTAALEREQAEALMTTTGVPEGVHTTWVPTLPGDVHTMVALATIRGLLFDGDGQGSAGRAGS